MSARYAWTAGLILLCASSLADPQQLPNPSANRRVETLERQTSIERRPTDLPSQRPSVADLLRQADELAQLGQSIPAEIQQADPADVSSKLRRIEKLSKLLRREITQ